MLDFSISSSHFGNDKALPFQYTIDRDLSVTPAFGTSLHEIILAYEATSFPSMIIMLEMVGLSTSFLAKILIHSNQ